MKCGRPFCMLVTHSFTLVQADHYLPCKFMVWIYFSAMSCLHRLHSEDKAIVPQHCMSIVYITSIRDTIHYVRKRS